MYYTEKKYLATALDPVHIGAGGQRLGRVDMTVVREPATKVPYIPGTSLSGALKFFADFSLRDAGIKNGICAAGEGVKNDKDGHDQEKCPVCVAFGYTPPDDKGNASAQGLLQFSDALLLASPVNTITGPVWLTTPLRLQEILGLGDGRDDGAETFSLPAGTTVSLDPALKNRLNLGWVLLSQGDNASISVEAIVKAGIPQKYARRFTIVSEWLFSQLVNDNMEVRTSVVIEPETGAAKDGGLFTYEAVPRGALFCFNITEHDYYSRWKHTQWNSGAENAANATEMMENFGFPGIKIIGLGGMTTRGFGCLDIIQIPAKA